jgi:hypothetical protein
VLTDESEDEACRLKPVTRKRMLFRRLDSEVVNLPHMADACNESDNLAE